MPPLTVLICDRLLFNGMDWRRWYTGMKITICQWPHIQHRYSAVNWELCKLTMMLLWFADSRVASTACHLTLWKYGNLTDEKYLWTPESIRRKDPKNWMFGPGCDENTILQNERILEYIYIQKTIRTNSRINLYKKMIQTNIPIHSYQKMIRTIIWIYLHQKMIQIL